MSQQYYKKVCDSVVAEIGMAGKGQRNEALNKAAFTLGRHAHMGGGDIDSTIVDLHTAAKSIGLKDHEIKSTIGSGFKRGSDNPKELDGSECEPFAPSEMDRLIGRLAAKNLLVRDDETRKEKIARAVDTWERSVPINRDNKDAVRPALLYLNSRGLRAATAATIARYSPSLYGGPAIIFPAVDDAGCVCGVQAVLLTEDGAKREHNNINKYSRGALVGNVMRIASEDAAAPIIMVEGPEDALSVHQASQGAATVVCTFGKSGLSTYNVPRASDVTICADPDLDVEAVSDVLRGDGSTDVHVVRFDMLGIDGVKDANDYLQEVGEDKLREALAQAKPVALVALERIEGARQWPTAFDPMDAENIPPRRWVYGQHYIRGHVSVLASAGGVGKTSLQIVEALAIATGRPLLGEVVHERCNVWIINLEDPLEEMHRRFAAAMLHYKIDPEEVRGRLFLDAGRDIKMIFARQDRDGISVDEEMTGYMTTKINELDIGIAMIDPWVGANSIQENDNTAMNAAVGAVRGVCDATDCAMGLVHHIRKGNGDDATADSIRGAGSLLSAARAARVINKISQEDAQKMGVPEHESLSIFRVDDGKSNLAPPAAKAVYRRMVGIQIPNGEYVGVAEVFKMPDLFDGVTAKHAMMVQRAVGRAEEDDDPYRENARSKRWVGLAVASTLELDLDKKPERARAKAIADKWIQTNVLKIEQFRDTRAGRDVPIVSVGEWITGDEAGL